VYLTTGFIGVFLQPRQIKITIVVLEEAGLLVVAALGDMHWHVWESQAGAARHRGLFYWYDCN
jgi:hypothetical protein